MFTTHIEGKEDPNKRIAGRKDLDLGRNSVEEEDNESREVKSTSKLTTKSTDQFRYDATHEKTKYELPQSCKFDILIKNKVEELDNGYILAHHPYPMVQGEMLLFQTQREDETEKLITYKDFSLKKRIKTQVLPAKMANDNRRKNEIHFKENTKI